MGVPKHDIWEFYPGRIHSPSRGVLENIFLEGHTKGTLPPPTPPRLESQQVLITRGVDGNGMTIPLDPGIHKCNIRMNIPPSPSSSQKKALVLVVTI